MNLKQLEAFVKVAETKSFSEAAKQLFLTQPTISAHVSALEKELNTCFNKRTVWKRNKTGGKCTSYWCFNRTGAIYSSKCNVYISCRISW